MFDVLAAGVHILPLAATVSTSNLMTWIKGNLVPLGFLFVGIVLLYRAQAKDVAGSVVTIAVVILAAGVMALGVGNNGTSIGSWALSLIWK